MKIEEFNNNDMHGVQEVRGAPLSNNLNRKTSLKY
jgi:hypothetical protein